MVFSNPTRLTKVLPPMWDVSSRFAAHFLVESISFYYFHQQFAFLVTEDMAKSEYEPA